MPSTFTPRIFSADEQDDYQDAELGISQSKKIFNAIFEAMLNNYPVISLSLANRETRCAGIDFVLVKKFYDKAIAKALKDGRITLRASIDKSEDSFSVTGLNKSAKQYDAIDRACFRIKE